MTLAEYAAALHLTEARAAPFFNCRYTLEAARYEMAHRSRTAMTTHKNRNPVLNATLDALRDVVIDAGLRRDGSAGARCETAIKLISAMGWAFHEMDVPADSPKRLNITKLREEAREALFFCLIHDQAARGELDNDAYNAALKAGRER